MNEVVKKAMEMMQEEYKGYIPDLEIGEICEINDVWDGIGEIPEESYSHKVTDADWINYEFEILEKKENELDTVIRIKNIELL